MCESEVQVLKMAVVTALHVINKYLFRSKCCFYTSKTQLMQKCRTQLHVTPSHSSTIICPHISQNVYWHHVSQVTILSEAYHCVDDILCIVCEILKPRDTLQAVLYALKSIYKHIQIYATCL